MVWDRTNETLGELDWSILGHTFDPENPRLPGIRCDIPMPATRDELGRYRSKS
jgi:hypothetical protein